MVYIDRASQLIINENMVAEDGTMESRTHLPVTSNNIKCTVMRPGWSWDCTGLHPQD